MDIYAQETFGPGLVVVRVKNEEEAIKLANGEFGLTSSVWTEDYKQALSVAKRIEASAVSVHATSSSRPCAQPARPLPRQVHINSVSVHDSASLPHGGHKNSGFGRFNGIHAAYTFTQTKTITLKEPADLPIFMLK
jgi:acyl-CoA reductase-like NAD-dependent aldehyde dehydrogenase